MRRVPAALFEGVGTALRATVPFGMRPDCTAPAAISRQRAGLIARKEPVATPGEITLVLSLS